MIINHKKERRRKHLSCKSKNAVLQEAVTPVKTGVQVLFKFKKTWIPAFAGITGEGG